MGHEDHDKVIGYHGTSPSPSEAPFVSVGALLCALGESTSLDKAFSLVRNDYQRALEKVHCEV